MAIAPVLQWLSEPNRTYHHGKLLYEQYGNNIVTKTIINAGHQGSSYHFSYLENALKAIANTSPVSETKILIPDLNSFQKENKGGTGVSDTEYSKLPPELKDIRTKAQNHFNRAKWLFARIPVTDSRAQRLQMQLQLLNDFDDNRALMAKVQAFLNTGSVTPEPAPVSKELKPVAELTIRELLTEAKNIPTYLTKDNKRLKDAEEGSAKYFEIQTRIADRQQRLEEINRRMNE
ncbi:MAG TPA: hypothetical protein VGB63_13105 [Pedobacter sp.]|jgi:hypothetical protein